jgi:uncharacterized repeat protein (TIGR03806 family)
MAGSRATHALILLGVAACGPSRAPFGYDRRPANATCLAPARPTTGAAVKLTDAFPGASFTNPLYAVQPPGEPSRWYVIEQRGVVKFFPNDPAVQAGDMRTALDIAARVNSGGEKGLLGIAFHPNFQQNRYVFLSFTERTGPRNLRSTVARYVVAPDGTLDPASETRVLPATDAAPNPLDQPYDNHNGGWIGFGKDGLLYFALGDGGSGGDPQNHAQNLDSLLGKILRVDVDDVPGGRRYGIPPGNPFARGGGAPELYAWGLRNPWRCSFDRASDQFWCGDVGQGRFEEIDLIRLGGNYGWRIKEGNACYATDPCDSSGLIDPVVAYGRAEGVSVTGGFVYRGSAIPQLAGVYLYGDFGSGNLWGLFYDNRGLPTPILLLDTGRGIASFAQDQAGEVYVVDYGGRLWRLDPDSAPPPDSFPQKLSRTGCTQPNDARRPADGLIPYEVRAALWSDGADKRRWLALPDTARIQVGADGDFDLPVGTVLVKEFAFAGRPVETRLFVRHADGEWAGYSYEWDDDGRDATLLPAGKTKPVGDVTWTFPSRSECLSCHTQAAGRTLGLELLQLNGDAVYPATNRISNQLATLDHLELLEPPLTAAPGELPALPEPGGGAPLEARARAYLHANCSGCHRPMGIGRGSADWRFQTPLAMAGVCDAAPQEGDLGVAGARQILPGDPAKSLVSLRMRALDAKRMPPLASSRVDEAGAALIDEWIRSLAACP